MKLSTAWFPAWLQRVIAAGSPKFIHLLAISIVLLLPEMLMNLFDVKNPADSLNGYIKTVVFILVFYAEYYWVVPRSVLRGRNHRLRFFAVNLLVLILALAVLYIVWVVNRPPMPMPPQPGSGPGPLLPPGFPHVVHGGVGIPCPSLPYMLGNLVMILLVMSLAVAVRVTAQLRRLADKRHESAMLQRELELSRIRSQINPHLLFNTLNTIYAMVQIDPGEAQKAIHQLSRILRYSLYNTSNLVPLQKEFEFIRIYCSLIKMRMGDRMNLDIDIDAGSMGETEVAPMLLINAVENAMKYGVTAPDEPIRIHLRAAGGAVSGEISNSYDPHERRRSEGAHIGLKNMRRRIDLLYGDRCSLDIADTGSRFTVRFSIEALPLPALL